MNAYKNTPNKQKRPPSPRKKPIKTHAEMISETFEETIQIPRWKDSSL